MGKTLSELGVRWESITGNRRQVKSKIEMKLFDKHRLS